MWKVRDIPPDLPIHQPRPAIQQPKFLTQHQTPTTLFEALSSSTIPRSLNSATPRLTWYWGHHRLQDCPLRNTHALERESRGTVQSSFDSKSGVVIVALRDNKVVTLASNYIGAQPTCTLGRWIRQETKRISVTQPNIVKEYNQIMGGVD